MDGRPGRPGRPGSGSPRESGGYRPSGGYRSSGGNRPSAPRRPGGSGGNDSVLPLITGVLGSSILAFSLYVFSQNHGVLEDTVHGDEDGPNYPSVSLNEDQLAAAASDPVPVANDSAAADNDPAAAANDPAVAASDPAAAAYDPAPEAYHPAVEAYGAYEPAVETEPNPGPKISIEKKRWLSEHEEETIKERRLKEKQVRGELQKELSEHLKKVKEIRDELHKEKKPKSPWE